MVAERLYQFFQVEIRNEEHGGVCPATLESAIESAEQADSVTLDDWCGSDSSGLVEELRGLVDAQGSELLLEEFEPARS